MRPSSARRSAGDAARRGRSGGPASSSWNTIACAVGRAAGRRSRCRSRRRSPRTDRGGEFSGRPAARSCSARWASGRREEGAGSGRRSGDLEDRLDLDRDAKRQRGAPTRPSGRGGRRRRSTATMRSEAPLITLGWSVKSAVELTKPVSLTTRTMRSRSPPQAARACASRLIAQRRAASAPSATSIVVAEAAPDQAVGASALIWPETIEDRRPGTRAHSWPQAPGRRAG